MKNPHEMRQKLGTIAKEMSDLISLRDAEKRSFTAEERTKFDTMKAEAEAYKRELVDVETALSIEAESAKRENAFGSSEKKIIKQFDLIRSFSDWVQGKPLDGISKDVQQIYRQFQGPSSRENSFLIPTFIPDELRANELVFGGGTGSGAGVVPKGVDAFVETLRAKMVMSKLGATFLTGLTDYRAIPYFSTSGAAYWAGEIGTTTASANVIATKTLNPNPVTAFLPVSRQMLVQHSMVEQIIFQDLANAVAAAIESVIIDGTGTNQPQGLAVSTSITDGTALGASTNGGAITWGAVTELMGLVESNNSEGNAYLTSPRTKAAMWSTIATNSSRYIAEMATAMGKLVESSSVVPITYTKGASTTCSGLFYGNWNDMLIAQWGAVELWMDPYSRSISNQILLLVTAFVDAERKRDGSFARNLTITS